MRWFNRLRYWLRFGQQQQDLRDELALHRELLAADGQRRGLSSTDARDAAKRMMGNETLMREESRGVWLPLRVDSLLQDARYAWRGLRRSPGFTLVAVVSLSLGIGANTAIFSLLNGLLLARLPVPSAAELVQPMRVVGTRGIDQRFSRAELHAMTGGPVPITTFAWAGASLEVDGLASNISIDAVDDRYFSLIGVGAQRGRVLSPNDDAATSPVVVVTDRFWRAHLNADPAALGRVIKINGHPFTIIGITPRGFAGLRFPAITDVTMPLGTALALRIIRDQGANAPLVEAVGRRPAAWTLARTQAELAASWARCCAAGENIRPPRGQIMSPSTLSVIDVSRGIPQLKVDLRGRYRRVLMALMAGVAILLLAACVNVGSLLLARSSARAHELAVRVALGASRVRLMTQLLVESLQLALLGAVGGVFAAWCGSRLLLRADIGDLANVATPSLSPAILAFTAIVSVVSAIVFGLVPASRVVRGDLAATIQDSGRRASHRSSGVLNRGLVALQIALALLLVSGAGLLTQTLRNLRETNLGFDPEHRLVFGVDTRRTAYERQGMTVQMADEMLRAIRALPGVRAAGFASYVPILGGRSASDNVTLPGGAPVADGDPSTDFVGVTPSYFAALGIPVRRGVDVAPPVPASTSTATPRDVVVNEAFARKFLGARDPLGQAFHDADDGDTTFTVDRIVGVVGDAKFVNPRQPVRPTYFVPVANGDWPYLELVVRVTGGGERLGPSIARALASIAPGITVNGPSPLSASIDDSLARERISAMLGALFGAIALALVAVGVYGVMLYQVTQRTREIGIRMALGASGRGVLTMVLAQSLSIVIIGVIAGVPLALAAGRAVSTQLYGVSPYDIPALLVAAATLVVVAIASTLVPARRAVTVDPLITLRCS